MCIFQKSKEKCERLCRSEIQKAYMKMCFFLREACESIHHLKLKEVFSKGASEKDTSLTKQFDDIYKIV